MNTDIRIYVMEPIITGSIPAVEILENGDLRHDYSTPLPTGTDLSKPRPKPTIEELEQLLNNEEEWVEGPTLEILPNGEVRAVSPDGTLVDGKTPLTFREDLGGEYAEAA